MEVFDSLFTKIQANPENYSKEDIQLLKFLQSINQKNDVKELDPPTPLRISTQSAKCKLTYKLNMDKVAPIVKNIVEKNLSDTMVGFEYKDIGVGCIKRKKKQTIQEKKKFYNQATIVAKPSKNDKNITIKFFLNGSISMTGCKNEDDGLNAVKNFIEEIKSYPDAFDDDQDLNELNVIDYDITMINSDYQVGFKINRDNLYKLMVHNYKIFTTYDPSIYQGVKISYMWNKDNSEKDGICKCQNKCKLDKNSKKKNICKAVTIAIFQSGKIVITGANNIKQTIEAYNYINYILYENYSMIVRLSILDCDSD